MTIVATGARLDAFPPLEPMAMAGCPKRRNGARAPDVTVAVISATLVLLSGVLFAIALVTGCFATAGSGGRTGAAAAFAIASILLLALLAWALHAPHVVRPLSAF